MEISLEYFQVEEKPYQRCGNLLDQLNEINVYDDICDAMAAAAKETGASIKWGAAWSEGDIRAYKGTAEDAMNAYIDLRRSQGRRPFIDGPHFELMA